MKKIIVSLMLVALLAMGFLSACTNDAATNAEVPEVAEETEEAVDEAVAEESSDTESAALTVGFIATNFSSEAQARVAAAFEKYAAEKGWEVVSLNSEGSIEEQSNQLENLVQMGVDAIVLAMGHPVEIQDAMNKVFEAGIPIITIDSGYVDGVVTDITSDNFSMGAKISTYMANSLGGTGNIIEIKFEKHQGCRERGKTLDVVLTEYPDINVLESYTVVATKSYLEDTRAAVETFVLKYGDDIDAIWCAFDQLAYVSADLLEEYEIEDVIVVGVDGNEETFRRIQSGNMDATIAQAFDPMAKKAIDLIDMIVVQGIPAEEASPLHITYVDAPLVTISNVEDFIVPEE